MADIGHEVIGVDIDPAKIETLNAGRGWFHEPELDMLLARNIGTGRLRFTTDFTAANRTRRRPRGGWPNPAPPLLGGRAGRSFVSTDGYAS